MTQPLTAGRPAPGGDDAETVDVYRKTYNDMGLIE